jgi:hypothetical protein
VTVNHWVGGSSPSRGATSFQYVVDEPSSNPLPEQIRKISVLTLPTL